MELDHQGAFLDEPDLLPDTSSSDYAPTASPATDSSGAASASACSQPPLEITAAPSVRLALPKLPLPSNMPAVFVPNAVACAPTPSPFMDARKASTADVQLVQNLIERCLQMYMPQKDVITTLHSQAKIDTDFTALVWQKLEEQNPDFFQSYELKLKLKEQIIMFNHLLDQQVAQIQKLHVSWLQSLPGSNLLPIRPAAPANGTTPHLIPSAAALTAATAAATAATAAAAAAAASAKAATTSHLPGLPLPFTSPAILNGTSHALAPQLMAPGFFFAPGVFPGISSQGLAALGITPGNHHPSLAGTTHTLPFPLTGTPISTSTLHPQLAHTAAATAAAAAAVAALSSHLPTGGVKQEPTSRDAARRVLHQSLTNQANSTRQAAAGAAAAQAAAAAAASVSPLVADAQQALEDDLNAADLLGIEALGLEHSSEDMMITRPGNPIQSASTNMLYGSDQDLIHSLNGINHHPHHADLAHPSLSMGSLHTDPHALSERDLHSTMANHHGPFSLSLNNLCGSSSELHHLPHNFSFSDLGNFGSELNLHRLGEGFGLGSSHILEGVGNYTWPGLGSMAGLVFPGSGGVEVGGTVAGAGVKLESGQDGSLNPDLLASQESVVHEQMDKS